MTISKPRGVEVYDDLFTGCCLYYAGDRSLWIVLEDCLLFGFYQEFQERDGASGHNVISQNVGFIPEELL